MVRGAVEEALNAMLDAEDWQLRADAADQCRITGIEVCCNPLLASSSRGCRTRSSGSESPCANHTVLLNVKLINASAKFLSLTDIMNNPVDARPRPSG